MNRYDILEAMSGIRDEYIEEAAAFANQAGQNLEDPGLIPAAHKSEKNTESQQKQPMAAETIPAERERKTSGEENDKGFRRLKILRLQRWAATAAALLCVCVIGFAIRSGQRIHTASEFNSAEPGMVSMSEEEVKVEEEEELQQPLSDAGSFAYDAQKAAGGIGTMGESAAVIQDNGNEAQAAPVQEQENADVSAASAMSDAGVTASVRQLTEEEVRVFENSLAEETGYSSLRFTHEITTDSDDWFSLKMKAYTCAADGFEQVTHFNINRDSSEYVTLETLFSEETDYITPLSREVIRQMREQMAADPDTEYWLDSVEGPEYDFQEISPAQDFYFDSDGNLVLCFNEGEAAPLYMGTVEFTIPKDITEKLLKSSI